MATGTEAITLRDLEGLCDWCGDECHPNSELCVVLSCNRCDDVNIYHQGCLEKFLKQYGFPSSRKVGFICPQGRGKGTKATKECPGRVDRSHPVIPKNEVKKKKASPPAMTEVVGRTVNKQPTAKPGLAGARKLAHPKPYELTAQFAGSSRNTAIVPSAWVRAEGVNLAVFEPPSEPVEPAYTATAAGQPKSAHVPVGLVLEEALTKAQRKNLARRKKKQQAVAPDDQHCEVGTAAADVAAVNTVNDWAAAELRNQAGSSARAGENLLAGHNKFVTNPARYLQLLGLLDSDSESDAEPDVEEDNNSAAVSTPVLSSPGSARSANLGSAMSVAESPIPPSRAPVEVPVAVPIVVPVTLPTAVPIASEATIAVPAAVAAKETADGDATLLEVLAQSMKQYELEQEINKQRMILAGELPMPSGALAPVLDTNAMPATPLTFDFTQASTVTPLVIQSPLRDSVPIFLPKMEPLGFTMATSDASLVHDIYGGYGCPEAGLSEFSNITLQQPKANMAVNSSMAGAYAPMAHGKYAPAMARNADDDGLGDLLALCGVAN